MRQELDRVLSGRPSERVWQLSVERKVTLRTAAYILGIGRVGQLATVLSGRKSVDPGLFIQALVSPA